MVIAFDGHVYSLKLIQSSVFVSFSLACATELPAGLLLTLLLDRWGRRFCGFITLAMTCLFSFAELLLQSSECTRCLSARSKYYIEYALMHLLSSSPGDSRDVGAVEILSEHGGQRGLAVRRRIIADPGAIAGRLVDSHIRHSSSFPRAVRGGRGE